jgi:hypothetical protein
LNTEEGRSAHDYTEARVVTAGYLPDFLAQAKLLGFTLDGHTGRGHPRLRHRSGGTVTIARTPSDYRSTRNALATLERLSGRKLPRQSNGKHRHRRQPQLDTALSPAEKQASEQVDALVAEADSLRHRFAELAAAPTRGAAIEARRVLSRYGHLRRLLAQHHHIIDPLIGGTP